MQSLRQLVIERAASRCEYCQLPQSLTVLPHQIDHIVSQKHGGETVKADLCLSCAQCNAHKGSNLSGIDPATKELTRLFHPRQDGWEEHFRWEGAMVFGQTEVGRTTVAVLAMNDADRVLVRQMAIEDGVVFERR